MIQPHHLPVPGKSLHEIARGPTYYPLLLNGEDHGTIRLKPKYRRWLIAVMRDGAMFAVESGSRETCYNALDSRIPPGLPAYLIYVTPKPNVSVGTVEIEWRP